jgi:hypothetical protein
MSYAYAAPRNTSGFLCCGYDTPKFYSSQDGGNSWQEIATPPPAIEQKLAEASTRSNQSCMQNRPNQCTRVDGLGRVSNSNDGGATWYESTWYPGDVTDSELAFKSLDYRPVCSKTNRLVCFRLDKQGQIERSVDGGANWSVDWQLPNGRQAYLVRSYAVNRFGIPADTRPLDIAVLDTAEGVGAIAAMGNQGVLVRTPQGLWEQRAVGNTSPLPYAAESLGEAFKTVIPELIRAVSVACLLTVLLSGIAYIILHFLPQETRRISFHCRLPVYVGLEILVSAPVLILGIVTPFVFDLLPTLWLIFLLGLIFLNWRVIASVFKEGDWFWVANRIDLVCPLIFFTAAFLPYFLWALGAVAALEVATILGISTAFLCFASIVGWIVRQARTT